MSEHIAPQAVEKNAFALPPLSQDAAASSIWGKREICLIQLRRIGAPARKRYKGPPIPWQAVEKAAAALRLVSRW
jgi:hypothetical protein